MALEPIDRNKMRELLAQDLSNGVVAERIGCSARTAKREKKAMRDEDTETTATEHTDGKLPKVLADGDSVNAQIAALLRAGHKNAEIMQRLHTSANRIAEVRRYIKESGEKLPEHRGRGIRFSDNAPEDFEKDGALLTWAGAFRRLAEYCGKHDYEDAYEYARKIARAKGMRL